MKIPLCLAVLTIVTGCAIPPPTAISPAISMAPPTGRYVDKRADVSVYERHTPPPARERVVGALLDRNNFVLGNGKTAAELVAGAATRVAPNLSEVVLHQFWTTYSFGAIGAVWCQIAADVTVGGRVLSVTGHGKNTAASASPRNLEIAVERAVEDFQKRLSMELAAPASWRAPAASIP